MTVFTCEDAILEYFARLQRQHGIINPAIKQICAAVQYKERRVQSAIHSLLQQGKITRTMDNRVNSKQKNTPIYYLTSQNNAPPIRVHQKHAIATDVDVDKNPWCSTNIGAMRYWQFMDLVERNTEVWCKARRVALAKAPAPTQQQVLHFPPDPEWYACFFWDDAHEQAA